MAYCRKILDIEKLNLKINRILIIFWGHFGDTLVTTPLLECLRKGFPGSYITYILGGSGHYLFEHASKILYHNPNVDKYIKSDESIFYKICLERRYDLAIDLFAGE